MFTKALSLDPLVNNLLNGFISCPLGIQGGRISESDNVTDWLTEALSFLKNIAFEN